MKTETKIFYNSPEAAQLKTVTGWVSSSGRFFGNDEHMARYDGSTHNICKCGAEMKKGYTICDSCIGVRYVENYNKLPFKEWDLETPVYDNTTDQIFFSADELEEHYEENEIDKANMRLQLCKPNYANGIDSSIWEDIIPDEMDDAPKELLIAIDEFNAKVKAYNKPISWTFDNVRTEFKHLES